MVNGSQSASTRAKILAILRNSSGPISGEAIASALSISRVAVWKAIKALGDAGYGITAGATGYSLTADLTDCLDPWEFGQAESLIAHLPETDSTMNRARDAALAACPDGFVVIADAQTGGLGTGGKRWDSLPGGLFFTIVTRPRLESPWAHRQVLAAQCALIRAIRAVSGTSVFPHWPNDLIAATDSGSGKVGESLSKPSSPETRRNISMWALESILVPHRPQAGTRPSIQAERRFSKPSGASSRPPAMPRNRS